MGPIGMPELMIILVIVFLLFGATKIPQLMKGFGQGISEFKKGIKEGAKEEAKATDEKDKSDKPKDAPPAP